MAVLSRRCREQLDSPLGNVALHLLRFGYQGQYPLQGPNFQLICCFNNTSQIYSSSNTVDFFHACRNEHSNNCLWLAGVLLQAERSLLSSSVSPGVQRSMNRTILDQTSRRCLGFCSHFLGYNKAPNCKEGWEM